MTWIKTINETDATLQLKEVYEFIKAKRGRISNIMEAHSLNPAAMKNHMDLYLTIMFGQPGLKREEQEMIAVVVSTANNCNYCVAHHSDALNFYWKDQNKIEAFVKDYKSVNISEKSKVMLDYALKLTKTPFEINDNDINSLRNNNFSDKDILNINLIVSYFNFINRIVLGLGVELSQNEISGYKY